MELFNPYLIVFIIVSLSIPLTFSTGTPSAYDMLQFYGFPKGILPKGVFAYELNKETGQFSAYMNDTCSFSLDNSYQLKYKSTISGVITKGRIKNLSGVSVKVLFFWLNIGEVIRERDALEFSVGIASAGFSLDNFEECPQCGCGLNCNELKRSPLVASS